MTLETRWIPTAMNRREKISRPLALTGLDEKSQLADVRPVLFQVTHHGRHILGKA